MTQKPKNAGKYGPGIIGEEAFALVKDQVKMKPDKYGPGILGEEKYAELMGQRKAEQAVEAPPQVKEAIAPVAFSEADLDGLVKEYTSTDGYLSIAELKKALVKAPIAFDRLFSWELNREDGPRIGALAHLLELETKREGGPRPMVLQRLEMVLKAKKEG